HRLLAGFILFPWSQATRVWDGLSAVVAAAPDELTVQSGVLSGPDGSPVLFLSPTWSGDLSQGAKAIEKLQRLGMPLGSQGAPMSHVDMLLLFDAFGVTGNHYRIRTRSLSGLSPDAVAAL